MTVAAIVIARDADPLAEAVGRPAVRRIIDAAWAGGAMPIVVVVRDAEAVQSALAGSPARAVASTESDAAAVLEGVAVAASVVVETAAVLLWPLSMTWVDPETVTSLIEAFGRQPGRIVRPVYDGAPGWPVLVPIGLVPGQSVSAEANSIEDLLPALADAVTVDLGDPGSVAGIEVEMDALPAYEGPPEPVGGPPPEWGAEAAETPD
jgi:CTP:molybdopterin cytidylyltransferase MocA